MEALGLLICYFIIGIAFCIAVIPLFGTLLRDHPHPLEIGLISLFVILIWPVFVTMFCIGSFCLFMGKFIIKMSNRK